MDSGLIRNRIQEQSAGYRRVKNKNQASSGLKVCIGISVQFRKSDSISSIIQALVQILKQSSTISYISNHTFVKCSALEGLFCGYWRNPVTDHMVTTNQPKGTKECCQSFSPSGLKSDRQNKVGRGALQFHISHLSILIFSKNYPKTGKDEKWKGLKC